MRKEVFVGIMLLILGNSIDVWGQQTQIALLKYSGGGDWYANMETSLPNLIQFANQHINTNLNPNQAVVEVGSIDLFNYPFVHMTGHGNVVFSESEMTNLRKYLRAGGFLHIDDNYGMDAYIRPQMLLVFPELEWVKISPSHPIFHQKFDLPNGLPKIHAHDDRPPEGWALFYEGRMIVFYSYESDLGDGWESPGVHNDPESTRQAALQMGANILQYVFMGEGGAL